MRQKIHCNSSREGNRKASQKEEEIENYDFPLAMLMLPTTRISCEQWFNILINVTPRRIPAARRINAWGYYALSFWQMISYSLPLCGHMSKDVALCAIEMKSRLVHKAIQMLSSSHYVPHQISDHLSRASVWHQREETRNDIEGVSIEIKAAKTENSCVVTFCRPTKEFILPWDIMRKKIYGLKWD